MPCNHRAFLFIQNCIFAALFLPNLKAGYAALSHAIMIRRRFYKTIVK